MEGGENKWLTTSGNKHHTHVERGTKRGVRNESPSQTSTSQPWQAKTFSVPSASVTLPPHDTTKLDVPSFTVPLTALPRRPT